MLETTYTNTLTRSRQTTHQTTHKHAHVVDSHNCLLLGTRTKHTQTPIYIRAVQCCCGVSCGSPTDSGVLTSISHAGDRVRYRVPSLYRFFSKAIILIAPPVSPSESVIQFASPERCGPKVSAGAHRVPSSLWGPWQVCRAFGGPGRTTPACRRCRF